MKYFNLKYIVLIFSSALLLSACDFMDCDESDEYTLEEMKEKFVEVTNLINNIYGYLPHDFCNTSGAMLDAASDDALHIYESSGIQRFTDGTWSPNYTVDDVFGKYYQAIHDANFFLREADGLTFDEWKHSDGYADNLKEYQNYPYEARFLRAFYYFELVKRYRNIPLVTTVLTKEEASLAEPSSAEKILEFIISECDELVKDNLLPVNYSGFKNKETGRATKGMAMALKSRATLYLASPLYSSYDQNKWINAAQAAYDLISQASTLGYGIDNSYAKLYGETNNTSKEVIMARPIGASTSFESNNFPMGVEGGKTSTCPTENLVSAYEMEDGSKFDWNNPTMAANPYSHRDPRLKLTVVYNNMEWPAQTPVQIWEGGNNGLPLANATTTGYYLRKYVNKDITFAAGQTTSPKHHNWILFRYAEILMNYAEAMVMAYHSPDFTNGKFPLSAADAIKPLRNRSDVQMPAIPSGLTETEFLERLKNERRVEFAFEGHRFWDIRRWKELGHTKEIYCVKIKKTGDNEPTYKKELLYTRVVEDKMYFYPISNNELFNNRSLKQNDGWDSPVTH